MNCNFKSNINLKSNLITEDKWIYCKEKYLPFDLLPDEYRDPSLRIRLTKEQRKRADELLFHCKNRREVKERIWQTNKCYENCRDCNYHNICY